MTAGLGADGTVRVLSEVREAAGGGIAVVALSGGLDSVSLLHLLRFGPGAVGGDVPARLLAAHFDHAMRPSSRSDALWIRGLCRAWDVPLVSGRADAPPASEAEAREARHGFLERVRRETGAATVLTAHHADDQAETVLFRVLRGTGATGLAGIPRHRDGWLLRPLLDVWRADLEAYAAASGLRWREDPTNTSGAWARNVLRHRVLPEVERSVAPGARRALVRLARLAREDEEAWQAVLPGLLGPLDMLEQAGGLSLARDGLAGLQRPVRARVLRTLAARLGLALDEAVTRAATDFVARAASGRELDLGAGVQLRIELERCVIGRARPSGPDRSVTIPGPESGRGEALVGGAAVPVSWGAEAGLRGALHAAFDPGGLRFPLSVRGRRPGDRILLPTGSRKVKKVLLERRVPHTLRARVPLLVDADGEVLWIPGIARAGRSDGPAGGPFTVEIG